MLNKIKPDFNYKEITEELWQYVHTRDNGLCQICAKKGSEVHHIIFRSHGGTNAPNNLILLCYECHHVVIHKMYVVSRDWLIEVVKKNEAQLRENLI